MNRLVLGVSLLVTVATASATTPYAQIGQAVRDVEGAFARYVQPLDAVTHRKPAAPAKADMAGAFGLATNSATGLSWTLTALTENQSVLCVAQQVLEPQDWNDAMRALSKAKMTPADSTTCASLAAYPRYPRSYPATIAGIKVLDRRDVPSPTYIPGIIEVTGVDAEAVTRPALLVSASSGPAVLSLYNPSAGPPEDIVSVLAASSREGFIVQQLCAAIAPGATCDVTVSLDPAIPGVRVGQLIIEFADGSVANIGIASGP